MTYNSYYKEAYKSLHVQIDMIGPKVIYITIGSLTDTPRIMNIPRAALSYRCDKGFGNIMTFPVTRDIEVANWLCRKEGL